MPNTTEQIFERNMKNHYIEKTRITLPFFEWDGDNYPLIAELPHGYKLVAHKNAPAITNGRYFFSLTIYHDDDAETVEIKAAAQENFHLWAWDHLRLRLDCPTYE
jgi:hypothetical protein